jgi:hypothetical protein
MQIGGAKGCWKSDEPKTSALGNRKGRLETEPKSLLTGSLDR